MLINSIEMGDNASNGADIGIILVRKSSSFTLGEFGDSWRIRLQMCECGWGNSFVFIDFFNFFNALVHLAMTVWLQRAHVGWELLRAIGFLFPKLELHTKLSRAQLTCGHLGSARLT